MKWLPKREPGDPGYKEFAGDLHVRLETIVQELRATNSALIQSQNEGKRLSAEVVRLTNKVAELTQLDDHSAEVEVEGDADPASA